MDIKTIEKYLKSPINSILEGISSEFKQVVSNRILEYQVEEYNRNLYSKTLLHRAFPKKLSDFYQPLYISKETKRPVKQKRIETKSVRKLFGKNKYITLIGNAGSGKSTLVKYLFVTCIDEKFKIPIKVELRYLNDFDGDLIDYIKNQIFTFQKLAVKEEIADRLLESGNFLFFLDGYDELNTSIKEETTKRIDDLVSRYNKNNFLLTSRPHTGVELIPSFHNYSVCNLNDEEIQSFVKKQIPSTEKELREKIIEAIQKPENSQYESFLRNPLLLSMFILTFQSYANIPQKKSVFYRQVFDTLFSLHDSISKLAYVREKECGLSKEEFEDVLKLFSFISFFEDKFIFNIDYLNTKFNIIKDKKKTIDFENYLLINDLTIAVGILNKEGLDYTFPHRSLQEYFAAYYIASLGLENRKRLYVRILPTLTTESIVFFHRANFYTLLIELDYEGVISEMVLPFFRSVQNELNSNKEKNSKQILDLSAKFSNVTSLFFNIQEEFSNFNQSWHSFIMDFQIMDFEIRKKNNKDKEVKNSQREEIRKDAIHRSTEKHLKPCLEELKNTLGEKIVKLENRLIEHQKSDEEIIDLIDFEKKDSD